MSDGDEWKDDDAPSPFSSFFGVWGKPLTPEERVEAERAQQAKIALGNLHGESLPRFTVDATCRKCGHDRVMVRYCSPEQRSGGWVVDCTKEAGEHEHMHRTCGRCRYHWLEKTRLPEAL